MCPVDGQDTEALPALCHDVEKWYRKLYIELASGSVVLYKLVLFY